MLIDSHRFGPVEIPEDKIITMKRPILGFENLTTFCLIERDELAPFLWLQSTQEADIAFLVTNPAVFYPDYRIEVNPREIAELGVERLEAVETYAILTVAEDPQEISINLQGPVLINTDNGAAKQLVLVNSNYEVKHRLMDAVDGPPQPTEARQPELAGA
jgi:flagellar assembly factor FliW